MIIFFLLYAQHIIAKFIERNINSLIRQNYKNFEVIYSDDGSTDETKYNIKKKIL